MLTGWKLPEIISMGIVQDSVAHVKVSVKYVVLDEELLGSRA